MYISIGVMLTLSTALWMLLVLREKTWSWYLSCVLVFAASISLGIGLMMMGGALVYGWERVGVEDERTKRGARGYLLGGIIYMLSTGISLNVRQRVLFAMRVNTDSIDSGVAVALPTLNEDPSL